MKKGWYSISLVLSLYVTLEQNTFSDVGGFIVALIIGGVIAGLIKRKLKQIGLGPQYGVPEEFADAVNGDDAIQMIKDVSMNKKLNKKSKLTYWFIWTADKLGQGLGIFAGCKAALGLIPYFT